MADTGIKKKKKKKNDLQDMHVFFFLFPYDMY